MLIELRESELKIKCLSLNSKDTQNVALLFAAKQVSM